MMKARMLPAPQEEAATELPPDFDEDQYQHVCACVIALGTNGEGGFFTSVERDVDNRPVPWPEVRVLQEIHGDEAVYDIRPVGVIPRLPKAREKERLIIEYGRDAVEAVYAGRAFTMEYYVPGWPIDPAKAVKRKTQRPKPPLIRSPDAESTDARV